MGTVPSAGRRTRLSASAANRLSTGNAIARPKPSWKPPSSARNGVVRGLSGSEDDEITVVAVDHVVGGFRVSGVRDDRNDTW